MNLALIFIFFFFLSSSKETDLLVWNRMHIVIILLLQGWHINIKTSNQRLRLIHQSFWMQSLLTQVFNRSEMFSVYCTSKILIRYKCNANTGELHRVKQIASYSNNRIRKLNKTIKALMIIKNRRNNFTYLVSKRKKIFYSAISIHTHLSTRNSVNYSSKNKRFYLKQIKITCKSERK